MRAQLSLGRLQRSFRLRFTVERLLNRVYARDPSLTILMNAEVLEVEHTSTDDGPR